MQRGCKQFVNAVLASDKANKSQSITKSQLMHLPDKARESLRKWASRKYVSKIAEKAECTPQHVRDVLKGNSTDGNVIRITLQLRKEVLIQENEAFQFLTHAMQLNNTTL